MEWVELRRKIRGLNISHVTVDFIQLQTSLITVNQSVKSASSLSSETWTLHSHVWYMRDCPSSLLRRCLYMYLYWNSVAHLLDAPCPYMQNLQQCLWGQLRSILHIAFLKETECKSFLYYDLGGRQQVALLWKSVFTSFTFCLKYIYCFKN